MIRAMLLSLVAILLALPASTVEADERQQDFISSSVSSVFDKIGKYTSGEKSLLDSDNENEEDDASYIRDATGRKIPARGDGM